MASQSEGYNSAQEAHLARENSRAGCVCHQSRVSPRVFLISLERIDRQRSPLGIAFTFGELKNLKVMPVWIAEVEGFVLGLHIAGTSENYGVEQEHLNKSGAVSISDGRLGLSKALLVRDPEGHVM